MANEKIWSFFMYLSNHMWEDETSCARGHYLSPRYEECNNVDLGVWDRTMSFLAERKYNMVLIDVGDGIKYESHPEISAPDAWDKDFLKKKLDEMRALGLEPIPKLNFSCAHFTWMKKYRKIVSTPEYYQFASDVIREVCEAFDHPRFIHLGLDEEKPGMATNRAAIHIRNTELWWHDAYFVFAEAEKNGARPWVWSDYFWDHPEIFAERMPKSVLQSNWYYNIIKDNHRADSGRHLMQSAYEKLDALGFDQVPCGSCCEGKGNFNLFQTLALAKDKLDDDLLKGFLVVPWTRTEPDAEYFIYDNAHRLYAARQKLYPETL
jgi:hypothetical protein